jgi:hypothetical protein
MIDCVYVTLLPSVTGLGAAELVTLKSACPAVATTTVAVALLLFGFGSVVEEDTFAVSVIGVPEAVPAFTVTTTVNVVEAPEARVAFEQVSVPLTTEQLHPAAGTGVVETNVVFMGIASLRATVVAVAAPLFVTTTVYVMLFPATTGLGDAVFVIERSAVVADPTVVCTVAELFARFGSLFPAVTFTTSVITVPTGTPVFTATPTVKVVDAAFATSGLVHEIVPVPPTLGVVQFQPEPPGKLKD